VPDRVSQIPVLRKECSEESALPGTARADDQNNLGIESAEMLGYRIEA
jgi:hypothetical protein